MPSAAVSPIALLSLPVTMTAMLPSRPPLAPILLLLVCLIALSLLPHPSTAAAPTSSPVPVILDTDIGDDFDDMMALTYILSAPHLYHPLAIVVSTRNTTKRALLVAHTLLLANRTNIPLYVGTVQPDNHGNYQYDSGWVAAHYTLADYRAAGGVVYDECGVCALLTYLNTYSGPPVHYIEIAPVTSLAAILDQQPQLASKLTVFAMNGQISVGYGNETGPQVEWNVLVDIPASRTMYTAAPHYTPLTTHTTTTAVSTAAGLITSPLDSTIFQQWNGALWQHFLRYNDTKHTLVALLIDAYSHWYEAGGKNNGALLPYSPLTGTSTMFDAQAAYTAAHSRVESTGDDCSVRVPHLISRCMCVYVNTTGYVVVVGEGDSGVVERVGCANVSVVIGLVGGRSNPYPAAQKIGAVILGSIAGVDMMSSLEEVVEVEVAVQTEME